MIYIFVINILIFYTANILQWGNLYLKHFPILEILKLKFYCMKKLKFLAIALCLCAGSMLPAKKANSQDIGGRWIVTIYSPTHWVCTNGGGVCCPSIDC